MAARRWSRYEFAQPHEDEDGNLFLDVPEPISMERRPGERRHTVGEGDTLWTLSWRAFKEMLDPGEEDVRPSGFWTVIAELNDVVDPLESLPNGKVMRVPGVEGLLDVLAPPRFYQSSTET